MKRALLWVVLPTLLVALGFAQTPTASTITDQTNIKGCLGGSEGNYTVVEDNTGLVFKIIASSVDLKPHLGHDATLIGKKASGASSATSDNSFAVTGLNMISEHCAGAAAALAATVSMPSEAAIAPVAPAATPAATVTAPPVTTPPAETAVTLPVDTAAPAASVTPPAETAVTPAVAATPAAETAVTPAVGDAASAATVSTAAAPAPAVAAAQRMRMPAHHRNVPASAIATPAPEVTATSPSETASAPVAAATSPAAPPSSSADTASTPAAATTTPAAPTKGGSFWLLVLVVVLIIVIGTMAPLVSRWRKRKLSEQTDAQNLSFSRDVSSDQKKSDPDVPRKAA